jgi:hypothetical protein
VAIGNANHGFAKVAFLVAHPVIHGAVRGAGFAFGDVGRTTIDFDGFGVHGGSQFGLNAKFTFAHACDGMGETPKAQ